MKKLSDYEYYRTDLGVLYLGNNLEILPLIEEKVDLILTDTPYLQEFHGRGMSKDRPNYLKIKQYGAGKNFDLDEFLMLTKDISKEKNYFFFCDKETKYELITFAKKNKYGYKELCFCKTSPTPFTNNQWLPDVEFGLHIFKNLKVRGSYETKRTFFVDSNLKEKGISHPTPKKIKYVEQILKNISEQNLTVLDPFLGSGTTAIACEKLNRKWVGIEISEAFCEMAKQRIKQERDELKLDFS